MFNLFKACGAFWRCFLGKSEVALPEPVEKDGASEIGEFVSGAIFTLNLLQREGRLIDFLQEDIESFSDAQVGTAVRQIHRECAATLEKYFKLRAISEVAEGQEMSISSSFDPSMIRVTGNTEAGKSVGIVRHKGWISSEQALPQQVGHRNSCVVCPAEINC
jgi:hypothetical protein